MIQNIFHTQMKNKSNLKKKIFYELLRKVPFYLN